MILGGFIVTFNRPKILLNTIHEIFSQTHPPDFLWVIDNSENLETNQLLSQHCDSRVLYHRMGYNSGPAGAAAKGLQLCYEKSADWIYWGDDNDPPFSLGCFERLLALREVNQFCGVLGSVGHFFDQNKGVIKRIQSKLLHKKEYISVDCIAGGMCMLVSKEVVKQSIFPDPDLFFGFEELDFCLKVKRLGFEIIVDSGLFIEARALHKRTDFKRPLYQKKTNLVREYYSLRNLLYISDSIIVDSMKKKLVLKWFLKSLYGFRYGPIYGIKNFKYIFYAYVHYFRGVKGKTFDLSNGI